MRRKASDCVKTNFEFLFSHYSTLFDYKLGLLNHFLSVGPGGQVLIFELFYYGIDELLPEVK